MTQTYPEPEPGDAPKKPTAKGIFKIPVLYIMVAILVIGIWFGSSFITAASNPTPENSLNYYGVAEVLDVGSTPSKCFVHIRRDDGRETKQQMRKSDCGKMHVGDMIRMNNGQYVSTIQNYPAPYGTLK